MMSLVAWTSRSSTHSSSHAPTVYSFTRLRSADHSTRLIPPNRSDTSRTAISQGAGGLLRESGPCAIVRFINGIGSSIYASGVDPPAPHALSSPDLSRARRVGVAMKCPRCQQEIRSTGRMGSFTRMQASPAPNGYRLTVACPCGVTFHRWITPQDAAIDMALLARWN
jgi:hypothetical protein